MAAVDALDVKLGVSLNSNCQVNKTLSNLAQSIPIAKQLAFALGTLAGQANQIYAANRSLALSANETLDLQGGSLTNQFGQTVVFSRIHGIYICNNSLLGEMTFGGAATPLLNLFGAGTHTMRIRRGGIFCNFNNLDTTGFAVQAAAGLKVVNEDVVNSLAYDILILGV